ncbi:hypothetical protein E2C01_019510 [Portunus trituberculatus]|uniref:Uncharacterized protein n=1 Tax=Portunus trituberculatus TaxID=210409 RepID=A0A5B7DYH2_PORTR|nr:hypothetical protein [Portunus trituberculatus]
MDTGYEHDEPSLPAEHNAALREALATITPRRSGRTNAPGVESLAVYVLLVMLQVMLHGTHPTAPTHE